MTNLPDLTGKVKIDTAQAVGPLEDLKKAAQSTAAETTKSFEITGTSAIKLGASIGAASQAFEILFRAAAQVGPALKDFVDHGAKVSQIAESYKALTAAQGQNYSGMLTAGRAATKGLISDFDLMANANKAMLLGLPVTAKEMATLGSAAISLGQAMNEGPKKAMDDLIIGLGRGSPKILDNLGIIVKAKDAHEVYAASIGKTATQLTEAEKKTAVYNAAIKSMQTNVDQLGGIHENLNTRLQQVDVSWQNVNDAMSEAVATSPVLNAALGSIAESMGSAFGGGQQGLVSGMTDYINRFGLGAVEVAEAVVTAWQALKLVFINVADGLSAAFFKVASSALLMAKAMPGGALIPDSALDKVDALAVSFKKRYAEMRNAGVAAFGDQIDGLEGLHKKMEQAIEDQHANVNVAKGAGNEIADTHGKIGDAAEKAALRAAAAYQKAAEKSREEWDKFYDGLTKMNWADQKALSHDAHSSSQAGLKGLDDQILKQAWRDKVDDESADYNYGMVTKLAEAKKETDKWQLALQGVALIAGTLPGKFGDSLRVIGNIGESFKGFSKMDKNGKIATVALAAGQLGGLVGGGAGDFLQGAGGGAAAGAAFGVPGAIIGGALGGILGIFGGKAKAKAELADLKSQLTDLSGAAQKFGIDLTAAFASKNAGTIKDAIKSIQDAVAEGEKRLAGAHDAASGLNLYAEALGKQFKNIVPDGLKEYYDQVDKEIADFEAKHKGKDLTKEETDWLAYQKHNRQATGDKIDNGDPLSDGATQGRFDRLGMYAGATFGALVGNTGDTIAALKEIGPTLDMLAKNAEEFGFKVSDTTANLLAMRGALGADGELGDEISGLNQLMKGLGDSAFVTKDLFAAFGADTVDLFHKLEDGGATGNQALALMQPTLQQLYEMQKRHGYAVDEATQALLDEAEAQGLVGDQFMSTNEQMVDLLKILIEAVGGELPEAYKRATAAARDFGGAAGDAASRGIPNGSQTSGGDAPEETGPGFAGGTSFRNFGSGTRATLHGEEAVLTRPQVDRLVGMAVAGHTSAVIPVSRESRGGGMQFGDIHVSVPPGTTNPEDFGRRVAATMIQIIKDEGPEAQQVRTALAGRR